MLDPYVLLTFKGTSRKEPGQPRTRAHRRCWGCWILTSSLLLKELAERSPAGERGSQKLLGVLDPYVLLTFKGIKQRGDRPAQERGSQKLLGVLDPYVLLTFKGTQQRGALPAQGRGSQKLPRGSLLLEAAGGAGSLRPPYFKGTNREEPPGPASPGERLPEAAGGAGSLRPPYF